MRVRLISSIYADLESLYKVIRGPLVNEGAFDILHLYRFNAII